MAACRHLDSIDRTEWRYGFAIQANLLDQRLQTGLRAQMRWINYSHASISRKAETAIRDFASRGLRSSIGGAAPDSVRLAIANNRDFVRPRSARCI
jgi:hypothetical protein